jgi:L-aspartate oxidase
MPTQYQYDVIVIGGGAAGLTLGLHLAAGARVALITKGPLMEGATRYAQGGVSAVLDKGDSIESHISDTLDAGAGLCDAKVVRFAVERAADAVQWLIGCGVPFTRETHNSGAVEYHLTREGGHSHRRVIHAADATGLAIEQTLEHQIQTHPNVDVFEHHLAVDLITTGRGAAAGSRCVGAYVLDKRRRRVYTFRAPFVVLATGGAGKAYLYTSNPDVATGDGIAMAWRGGCRVANMEFIQFHPTCLYHPEAKSFLITEAVRGEGGKLLLPDGSRFMAKYDARGELAPRDIVARAIDQEMKRLGIPCVYLDISHAPADFTLRHFPTVYRRCLDFGFDMTKQPLPVVPAAHYTCGGVMTDLRGATDLPGLYAIGETAFTGFHGANRMASNSLLECLVFAMAAATDINAQLGSLGLPDAVPDWDESRVTEATEEVTVAHNWDELRRCMWDYVGIVRSTERLLKAKRRIDLLSKETEDFYQRYRISNDLIELRNLTLVADLIVRSALARRESRGLHYTLDYPDLEHATPPHNTVLVPANAALGAVPASAS